MVSQNNKILTNAIIMTWKFVFEIFSAMKPTLKLSHNKIYISHSIYTLIDFGVDNFNFFNNALYCNVD